MLKILLLARRIFSCIISHCLGIRILFKQETWRLSFIDGLQSSLRLWVAVVAPRVLKAVRVRHKPVSCVPSHYVKLIGSIKLS